MTQYYKDRIMESKNIFEGAKFDDKFVTRDGRVAIYSHEDEHAVYMIVEGMNALCAYHLTGVFLYPDNANMDIVSRHQETTDNNYISDETIMRVINAIGYESESWIQFVREHLE